MEAAYEPSTVTLASRFVEILRKEGETVLEEMVREDYNVFCVDLGINSDISTYEGQSEISGLLHEFVQNFVVGRTTECSKALSPHFHGSGEQLFKDVFDSKEFMYLTILELESLQFNLETYCQAARRNILHEKDEFAKNGFSYFPGDIYLRGESERLNMSLVYRKNSGAT